MEPVASCSSPDGHSPEDLGEFGSEIPVLSLCTRCGARYEIFLIPEDSDA